MRRKVMMRMWVLVVMGGKGRGEWCVIDGRKIGESMMKWWKKMVERCWRGEKMMKKLKERVKI